jgi:hypothetical protein
VVEVVPPYALDKVGLLVGVASALRCRSVRREGQGHRGFSVHLFGFGSDLERVELLFTSLLVQAAYGLAAAVPRRHENVAAFRRSWLAGFSGAVSYRLREAEQRAATTAGDKSAPGGSMVLVLVDRSEKVARRVAEVYPQLVRVGPRRLTGSGLHAGRDAGHRADLGGGRVPSGRRAAALGR